LDNQKLNGYKEERYLPYAKRAFAEFISEQVDGRLKTALAAAAKQPEEPPPAPTEDEDEDIITELEWQGYYAVKSLLMGHIDPARVILRNLAGTGRSGIGIDNRGKPLVTLNFQDPAKMRIELVLANKERQTHAIAKIDDLLAHADAIKATVQAYLAGKPQAPAPSTE
jgi:hypothetical protein